MKAKGIHHIDLRVTDYHRSIRFYDRILRPLGFTKSHVRGETVTYYIQGESSVGIRPVKHRHLRDISYSYKRAGIHHLAISVRKKEDVDDFYELLKRDGAKVLHGPMYYPMYARGYYSVFFLDPDGIQLEVLFWSKSQIQRRDSTKEEWA